MKNMLGLLLLVGFLCCPVVGERVIPLPEDLIKPFRVVVDDQRIFIAAGPEVYVLDKSDGRLLNRFGKEGEGPGEFKLFPEYAPELDVNAQGILASSLGKISLYSPQGNLIWEKKMAGLPMDRFSRLLEDRIIDQRLIRDGAVLYQAYFLCGMDQSEEREFHRHKYYRQRPTFNPIASGLYVSNVYVHGGEIFLGGEIGSGSVHVYDSGGRPLRVIRPPFDPVPFTAKDKQSWIDSYMSNDEYKQIYERIKDSFAYPDVFPLFQNLVLADGRLYFQTFKRNDAHGENEVVITDLNGKVIRRVWLPFVEYFDYTPNPYTFRDETLYQLVENEDTEVWELHLSEIR